MTEPTKIVAIQSGSWWRVWTPLEFDRPPTPSEIRRWASFLVTTRSPNEVVGSIELNAPPGSVPPLPESRVIKLALAAEKAALAAIRQEGQR